jgi:hypothetical protein
MTEQPLEATYGVVPPLTDRDSDPWWEAVRTGQLKLPHCPDCGATWFPATPRCPECGEANVQLIASSGQGHLYSWVVVNRALSPVFAQDAPYTIVAVDLDDGARMVGRLLGEGDAPLRAGEPLHAAIYKVQGQSLVGFRRSVS